MEVEEARARIQESDADAVLDWYNHSCSSFPKVISMTPKRKEAIHDLLSQGISLSQIQEAFRRAEQSDFLSGRVKGAEWNRFDFDWLIQPSSIVSLLEGKYDNVSVQKQKRIEKNQALFLQSTEDSTESELLTQDKVEEYPSYLKDALKRHNCFPEEISNQEVQP